MLNKFWLWLDGKKRDIAGLFCFFTGTLQPIIFPSGLPAPYGKIIACLAAVMLITGWTHAGQKYLEELKAKGEQK
jgi:hypothetical protein